MTGPSNTQRLNRAAREIIAPLVDEVGRLNGELTMISAIGSRGGASEAARRDLLGRVLAARAALERIDQQLAAALHNQPDEVCNHSSIRQFRASIAGLQNGLRTYGG